MAIRNLSCLSKVLLILITCFLPLSSPFKITGAPAGFNTTTGGRPSRLEINDFVISGPAFDLYIQALNELQKTDQGDPLSYFQIAGIHGFPQVPWNGVNGSYPANAGFCMHGAITFPTWHRPYLALMEQVIWTRAGSIARTYPANARNAYEAAALTLRLPYWDWALHPIVPEVMQYNSISIRTPNGQETVENPLYDYNFQGNADVNGFPRDRVQLADFPYTVRHLDLETNQSNLTAINAELLANAGNLMSTTYTLFSQVTDYFAFSCVAPNGQANTDNNVENLHGFIHNAVGGIGHMTWPELSAFDPIFWLHHANVDRLFAMWQVLNPNSYFGTNGALNVFGSFYEPPGSIDTGSSVLAPFHSDNGSSMFTNDGVRSIARFNYGYLDIPEWNVNGTQLMSYVRTQVNAKYNPPAQQRKRTVTERPVSILQAFSDVSIEDIMAFGVNNADMQWTISVTLAQFAYETAFSIHFFMGSPPTDRRTWPMAPNLVGTHAQFIPYKAAANFPPGGRAATSRGEVSLTHVLLAGVDRGLLTDLSPATVVPILRQALTWRATTPDGCEIDLTELEGLSIAVGSKKTTPAIRSDRFPSYDSIVWHFQATGGKIGGASFQRLGRRSLASVAQKQS